MKQTKETSSVEKFSISITAIRDLGFSIKEKLFIPNKQARVEFKHITNYNLDTNIIVFNLESNFYYPDAERVPSNNLVHIFVQNVFTVPNLKNYISDKKLLALPSNAFITIVGLSVSHSRALLATHTSNTVYQQTILPIIDAIEMTKSFFPQAFNKSQNARHLPK